MDLQLKDKVVLITGGSRGIGRSIARRFAEEGAKLAICARNREGLDTALNELKELGAPAWGRAADISQPDDAKAFVEAAAAEYGGIDILINNVGGSSGGTLENSTDEDWVRTFDLNLFHAVRSTRLALPHFRKRGGGSVVTIPSISGWKPAPGAQYGAAKAAEIFLAGALALQLAEDKVRVNTVCPGSILFPGGGWERFSRNNPEDYARFRTREFPAQRLGSPEEIADVVVFVASPRAGWINGASIPVDGAQGRPSAF